MKIIVRNRRAYYDYEILRKFQAGVVLTGWETKSIRLGNVKLDNAFVLPKKNELFIKNLQISKYMSVAGNETQDRKLLLNRFEIKRIVQTHETQKLQIVPLKIYFQNNWIKVEIALAKTKKAHEKRQAIKTRDNERHLQAVIKRSKLS